MFVTDVRSVRRELETDRYFAVRMAMDGLAAELAARRVAAKELLALRTAHHRLVEAVRLQDRLAMVMWNVRFHEELYRVSSNRPLLWIAEPVLQALVRFTLLPSAGRDDQQVVIAQHEDILRALEAGDVERARLAAAVHVRTMHDRWRLALGQEPTIGMGVG